MRSWTAWLHPVRRQRLGDGALAAAVALLGVAGHLAARTDPGVEAAPADPVVLALAIAAALVVLVRRRHPLSALGGLALAVVLAAAIRPPGLFSAQVAVAVLVGCHALGRWCDRRRTVWVVLGVLALLIVAIAVTAPSSVFAALAFAAALVLLPGAVGAVGRTRTAYLREVEARLADAERERAEREQAAVVAERARIARELHDVVAHHVSLIGVQAGAARATLEGSPDRARAALAGIEQSSRDAVTEMRRLLQVLRPLGPDDRYLPQPTLEDLPATAARWREAGLDVRLRLLGPITALDAARSTCAYRIAEEALTNVARHSRASLVHVTVAVVTEVGTEVSVEVVDAGPRRADAAGAGRGLIGMRERAALFGGVVVADRHGPGFRVAARLPRSTDD